ncbi:hypothetical protein D9M71_465020 [compost metagenome]
MGHQGRADGADGHERQWRPGDVGFFEEDQLFGGGIALAAMGLGPTYRQPAVAAHLAHSLAVQLAAFLAAQALAQLGGHQRLEVVAHLTAQRMLLGGEIDEHAALLRPRQESGRWSARQYRR